LVIIDVISPLPFPTTLEHSGLFCDFFNLVLNPQVVAPFDVAILLFPSFVQPSLNANIHVDFLATFSKNVVILSVLFDMQSNLDLLPMHPPQKLKKSYDYIRKFQLEWVTKCPWAESV
jgi:hypothetical protein